MTAGLCFSRRWLIILKLTPEFLSSSILCATCFWTLGRWFCQGLSLIHYRHAHSRTQKGENSQACFSQLTPIISRRVFNILSSCNMPFVWARSLVTVSGLGELPSVPVKVQLVWIRTLACEAGDLGFKSQRARQKT